MKTTYMIAVQGKTSKWNFTFEADDTLLSEWRADGLEVYEVVASVPQWAASIGLTGLWAAVQRVWRFMRLW
jgi:hypothetical protein